MGQERVFIIEDEAVVSEFLRAKIESIGYDVVGEAKKGEEAIAYCEENPVDVLLVDIKLEGEMDGIETAKEITKDNDCVVIYLTAYSGSELVDRAKETQPAGYLIKPIDQEELVCTLDIALHNHELKKERNQAIREKEELLEEIRDIVDQNLEIISDLLEMQVGEKKPLDLDGKGDDVIDSMLQLKEKLNQMETQNT